MGVPQAPDTDSQTLCQGSSLSLAPQPVNPLVVRQLCIQLAGPNYRRDVRVLSVAQAILHTPLPVNWKHAYLEGNRSVYIDKRTSLFTVAHPSLKEGKKLLKLLCSQPAAAHESAHTITTAEAAASQQESAPQAAAEGTATDSTSADTSEAPKPAEASASSEATEGEVNPAQDQPSTQAAQQESTAPAAAPSAESTSAANASQPTDAKAQHSSSGAGTTAQSGERTASWGPGPTCMQFAGYPPGTPASSSEPADAAPSYWFDFATEDVLYETPAAERVVPSVQRQLLEECGLVARPAHMPSVLTFYSWWYEDAETSDLTLRVSSASEAGGGLRRYYCTVQFDVARQTFSLRTSTDDQELAYGPIHAVTSSSSTTVELWDLHVGATVVILGKRVTLLKADLETVEWNRYHAQRLQKLKKELEWEVQKYKPRAHPNAITCQRGCNGSAGELPLKMTITQINALIEDLRQYRPSKADAYQARIGIETT